MSARTRIKICGLTQGEDLQQAIAAGADSIGLVFCEKSPRHLQLDAAAALVAQTPAFVSVVALFLNPEAELVQQVLRVVRPELLQFHGQEPEDFCRQFGRRYLKAVAMAQHGAPLEQARQDYPSACGLLVDSHAPGAMGGQGEAFDWGRLQPGEPGLVLAGGLNPQNVEQAVRQLRPWAVDVSSGVEDSPGCKSAVKMSDFVAAVHAADGSPAAETGN